MDNNLKVSVIIPAFNEALSIRGLVSRIKTLYPDFEVIVINDGSSDNTAAVAKDAGARVFSHPYNIGNGAAIKSGIREATGEILVFIDGDAQHSPEDIGKLVKYLPEYDMVVGKRSGSGQSTLFRALGNFIFNRMASYVSKFRVRDLTSGFRAVKAIIAYQTLHLLPNTYSYPTTMTLCVLRSGYSVKYVPVEIKKRRKGKSGIKIINDGVRFFMIILRICTLFSPMRIFLPVSFLIFFLGLFNYAISYLIKNRFTNMSMLLFISSLVIFMMGLISEQICQMRYERVRKELLLVQPDKSYTNN